MSFFCIHGSRLLLLIILLFIEQRKQVIAVKCLICKILKRKCFQTKILKLLSFAKLHCASNDIFLKFLRSKLNFLQAKKTSIWSKKSLIFCNFLNSVHTQRPNLRQLQYVTNTFWKFWSNGTNRLFVVWVRVNQGQIYIYLQSNVAWNFLKFIVWR